MDTNLMRLLQASAFLAVLVIFTCTLTIDCRLSTSANFAMNEKDRNELEGDRSTSTPAYAKTSAGIVRGYTSYVAGIDKPAKVFKGIPFAEPPIGPLRFAKPRIKASWNGVWDATKYRAACLSNTTRTTSPQHNIDEDCLYINVFAGSNCSKTNLCPVLFYVFGGAFTFGSATMFNDTEIIRKYASDNIVFVLPGYRLGTFGFFGVAGDDEIPRNLGLHDIIMSLKWARDELEAFGGDKNRVTLWGNSAGGTAIWLLCVSPAVPTELFRQVFISSGEPYFAENVNDQPSRGVLEHVGCLYDKSRNRTLSSIDRLACLRRVPAADLLRAQTWLEDERGIEFSGPESDVELLPARNFAKLLPTWKPRNTVLTVMLDEFPNNRNKRKQNITKECATKTVVFGYTSKAALDVCTSKYKDTVNDDIMRVRQDAYRAEAFLQSYVNADKGADSYLATFNLANHTKHANDLTFLIGLHPVKDRDMTPAEKLMDRYYPEMIKRFLRTGRPDKDWKPLATSGSGYFVLDFRVQNGTLEEKPHFDDGYFYPASLKFWLSDLAKVNAMAGGLALANGFGLQALSSIDAYRVEESQVPSSDAPMEAELRRTFWTEIVLTAMGLILLALYLSYRFTGVAGSAHDEEGTLMSEETRLIPQGYTVKYS